jgi:hypothetical protein
VIYCHVHCLKTKHTGSLLAVVLCFFHLLRLFGLGHAAAADGLLLGGFPCLGDASLVALHHLAMIFHDCGDKVLDSSLGWIHENVDRLTTRE